MPASKYSNASPRKTSVCRRDAEPHYSDPPKATSDAVLNNLTASAYGVIARQDYS